MNKRSWGALLGTALLIVLFRLCGLSSPFAFFFGVCLVLAIFRPGKETEA